MKLKFYRGLRTEEGCIVTVDTVGDLTGRKLLNPRLDLRNHSPTGFEWGYGGSGPAQLALAILADHLGADEEATDLYQRFKFRVIAGLDGATWQLSSADIEAFLDQVREPDIA
jgi:uncharacterized protein DUF6166